VSVTNVGNPLQPTGISGPPEIMVGIASVTGDVSGGNAVIQFDLPGGWLWMPNVASTQLPTASTSDVGVRFQGIDDAFGPTTINWNASSVVAGARFATNAFVMPRMLFKTVTSAATIEAITQNVDGDIFTFYVRMLRWDKNSPPQAWAAFMVAPP